jgi:hypothetical protein
MSSKLPSVCAIALLAGAVSGASAQSRLFGIDGLNLIELNPTTGAVITSTPITGGLSGSIGGLAYNAATDTMYLSSTTLDNLWRINYNTGAATLVGDYGVGTTVVMHGLGIDNTGQLYGYSTNIAAGARFFSINGATGQATGISDPGFAGFGSLGFVAATGTMYVADTVGDQLFTINRTTGVTTLVGPFGIASQVGVGLAYDPAFGMLAVNNTGTDSLYSLNLQTGAATLISNLTTTNILSLEFVIPAPGTAVLVGVGGLALFRRRR